MFFERTEKRNAKGEKLYPFSLNNNDHHLEYLSNLTATEGNWDLHHEVDQIRGMLWCATRDWNNVAWITGKEYGRVRKVLNKVAEYRAANAMRREQQAANW